MLAQWALSHPFRGRRPRISHNHVKEPSMSTNRRILAALFAGALAVAGCAHLGDKSVGATIDDATITSKVKAKFVADSTVKAMDIKVNTFEGVVQLAGFANSPEEARRAEVIARETAGVKSVKNDIRLAQR
jgi:osmotically-inducible protein OsmY